MTLFIIHIAKIVLFPQPCKRETDKSKGKSLCVRGILLTFALIQKYDDDIP